MLALTVDCRAGGGGLDDVVLITDCVLFAPNSGRARTETRDMTSHESSTHSLSPNLGGSTGVAARLESSSQMCPEHGAEPNPNNRPSDENLLTLPKAGTLVP
jgi:hypothetical protein